ncbi:UDP-2,4-diacetamido-2,4,6-trideoxy-beta-L-altropyranose hydrolase [Sulfurimonas sp. SAG-AH-194-C21]|nr:UDP-2,4-diacetamido-2,4,6-trideoxy-beta-L-altropyranose hydrolase [Sulfurimonas sp. SAG-AH-194-C21]MDF1883744.1 UDP-2,4-diacetamido-2,4,6-trideoxy-beta-L-altropyranose hydrolase [Sulfurimonas sp. SAG-AH-194-C21]
MKKILFRVDSSSTIGTGHIMRDLVLAQQYQNASISFATQNLEGNIDHTILEAHYHLLTLESNTPTELIELIKKHNIDLLVIDHYEIDYQYEKEIKEITGVNILAFDDTYEKHHCDILLNHNISAEAKRYKNLVPKNCELRCGSKYTLLRDEFMHSYPPKIESKDTYVLIALGGIDSTELNIPILKLLLEYNNLKIDLVTTTANTNLKKLQNFVKEYESVSLHINTKQMAKLMSQDDFAIITPSVTLNEAYFMKLPFIAIKTQENQHDIFTYLKDNNYQVINNFSPNLLQKELQLMQQRLHVELINFTNTTHKEKELILEWRNDEYIKKWMHKHEKITLKEHLFFINSLHTIHNKQYFLVKDKSNIYGVVNLTNIIKLKSAELGIYAKIGLKGAGTLLMHKIIDYTFHTLFLKKLYINVYADNTQAIKLYKKFNFILVNTTINRNLKLYTMELNSENR